MLEIKGIKKSFGKKEVLKDINITLNKGIYGLLGSNGAGKTTLINIITGLMEPDAGEVLYNGINIKKKKSNYRDNLGLMPQYTTFYGNFTAKEFLKYMCVIKGIPAKFHKEKISNILEKVNLTEEANNKIGTFSGGMRQRVGIAQAIINDPEILILDEPTAGLDPGERIRFRNLISDISADRTVILATHIVPDIDHIANEIILINNGNVEVNGKPDVLLEQMKDKVALITTDKENLNQVMSDSVVSNLYCEDGKYTLRIVTDNIDKYHGEIVTANLEDLFLYYTQKGVK